MLIKLLTNSLLCRSVGCSAQLIKCIKESGEILCLVQLAASERDSHDARCIARLDASHKSYKRLRWNHVGNPTSGNNERVCRTTLIYFVGWPYYDRPTHTLHKPPGLKQGFMQKRNDSSGCSIGVLPLALSI